MNWTKEELRHLHPHALQALMGSTAETIRNLQRQELTERIKLGHLLHEIQRRHLWDSFTPRYLSWRHLLDVGFEAFTGLHSRTAHKAMKLAASETLGAMEPEQLSQIPSVAIADHIARLDSLNVKITPEALATATKPEATVKEFKRATGASEGYVMKLWVNDVAAGQAVQALLEGFFFPANRAHVTAEGACNIARLLEDPRLQALAGGQPDAVLDFLRGLAEDELLNLEARQRAEHGLTAGRVM